MIHNIPWDRTTLWEERACWSVLYEQGCALAIVQYHILTVDIVLICSVLALQAVTFVSVWKEQGKLNMQEHLEYDSAFDIKPQN